MNIEKIPQAQVTVGQEFKSYSALCDYVGVPATTGKQRQLDQRHLKCFFTWEKVAGANRLVITETFYDAPKPFEDGRKGAHLTRLNGMMQNLILSTPWTDSFLSRYEMLSVMELVLPDEKLEPVNGEEQIHQKRTAAGDYSRKLNDLFKSACTQLKKQGYAEIKPVVINIKTGVILSEIDAESYHRELRCTLGIFGAFHMGIVYARGQEKEFWNKLDIATNVSIGQSPLRDRMQIVTIKPECADAVDRKEFVTAVADKLKSNYADWYYEKTGIKDVEAIGITRHNDPDKLIPPKQYRQDVDAIVQNLVGAQ